MIRILNLILLFFIVTANSAQTYPVINSQHPRLYVPQSRFNFLDSNKSVAPVSSFYNQFVSNYFGWWYNVPDFYLVGSDSTQWNYIFRYFTTDEGAYRDDMCYTGMFTAFIYKLNHDPLQLKRTRFIIRKFVASVDTMAYNGYTGDNLETMLRYFGIFGSSVFDWCRNDIDSSLRRQFAATLYKLNRKFVNSFITTSAGNSYVSSHNAWNCVLTLQNIIAINNEIGSGSQADSLNLWYSIIYDKWINGFMPVYGYYRSNTGGWNWGAAYSVWGLPDQFTLFDNFLNGTDKNFYNDYGWISNSINQYYYLVRPDNVTIHQGDGETFVTGTNSIYRHAAVYQDQRSRWLAQEYSKPKYLTSTYTYFNILCFKDFSAPAVVKPVMPLNWFADRVGLLVSSSTNDSNAVQYWHFNSHSKRASHEHRDNNTFSIYYRKPLLIDAGYYDYYGSAHFKNYYTRTAAHNVVTVYDSTEQFYYGGEPVSNDGGQIYSNPLMNYGNIFETQFQRGRWTVYAPDSAYVYSNSDATMSYNPQKVKRYIRKIVYIKPKTFVLLDNLILQTGLNQNLREVRWLAHFANQPQISGDIINVQVPGHIETFSGKQCVYSTASSYIAVNNVYPDSTKIKRIGGSGYEYWVNGANYPTSGNPDTVYSTAGKWRIEVIPKLTSDTVNMIHTLHVNDIGMPQPETAVRISNESTLGCDYVNSLFLFNSKGDTAAASLFAANVTGGRIVKLFCFDLKKNTPYFVHLNGALNYAGNADSTGIIVRDVYLPPGFNSISISLNQVGITETGVLPITSRLYQNQPNPFNPVTKIRFDVGKETFDNAGKTGSLVSIKVFDITGRILETLANRVYETGTYSVDFDGSKYPSGIYFIKMKAGKKVFTSKCVLLK